MDLRHRRRERSRKAICAAIERLVQGKGTHPRHAGLLVRITKEAVAREARVSVATLYRSPDLVEQISSLASAKTKQRPSVAEQHRTLLRKKIVELERQVNMLLAENLRLTRLLAKHDSSLVEKTMPIVLEEERKRRRH